MFSVVSVCHSVNMDGEGSLYLILYGILVLGYPPTSAQGPGSCPLDTFKLVPYEARTVGKRSVRIQLKCLLVNYPINQKCSSLRKNLHV